MLVGRRAYMHMYILLASTYVSTYVKARKYKSSWMPQVKRDLEHTETQVSYR